MHGNGKHQFGEDVTSGREQEIGGILGAAITVVVLISQAKENTLFYLFLQTSLVCLHKHNVISL